METARPFHLVSIAFSHYVEKARWTLDYFGKPYTETALLPMLHFGVVPFYVRLKGKGDRHSSRFATPVLKTDEGEVIQGSSKIMERLSDRFAGPGRALFPNPVARELDEHFNQELGPHSRRVAYYHLFASPAHLVELADKNVSRAQATAFKTLLPLIKNRMVSLLGIDAAGAQRSRAKVYREFEAVEARLKDGRPFLTGDRFTAADISFACLGGAILVPTREEGYSVHLPDRQTLPEGLRKMVTELRATRAGKWALGVMKSQRPARTIVNA